MSTKHDVNTVKIAAMGHWPEILNQLTYIPMTSLDGEHHPCPICAGTDRFNVDRNKFAETGSCHCNQQCGLSGDGFHVLRTINGWDFPTAIHEVGRLLGNNAMIRQNSSPQPKPKRNSPKVHTMLAPAITAAVWAVRQRLPNHTTIDDQPNQSWYYYYADETEACIVLRFNRSDGKKEIIPIRRDAEGWCLQQMPDPRPLYRLTHIADAETVWIAEGEKAADAIVSFGLEATTNAGGSKSVAKTDWRSLDCKRVIIVPDNDTAGKEFVAKVTRLIRKQAPNAEILIADLHDTWPEIPEKGDAADWSEHFDSRPVEWFRDELERIAKPIELPSPFTADEPTKRKPVKQGLRIHRASDVVEKPLRWLWKDRFLIGHVNIIAGDPGLGKSMTAVDIAARVSTGNDFPDGSPCEQGVVLYSTTEDGYADTVKPRLNAAGANIDNILFLDCCVDPDGSEGPVYLDEHLWLLDAHLEKNPDIRLLVLDTLQSFVGSRTNTNNNASSRRIMTPLKRLAEKHHVAVLCIEHLNKGSTTKADNATYRIQGSIAFCGAARSVWIVCKDKHDPALRYLQASKTNLAPDSQGLGLSYKITGVDGRPFIQWQDTNISTPISELLCTDESGASDHAATQLEQACRFLRRVLTEPVSARDIAAGCKAEMISEATLRRAKEQLGIQSSKDGKNWLWLPSEQMQQDRINGIASLFPD